MDSNLASQQWGAVRQPAPMATAYSMPKDTFRRTVRGIAEAESKGIIAAREADAVGYVIDRMTDIVARWEEAERATASRNVSLLVQDGVGLLRQSLYNGFNNRPF